MTTKTSDLCDACDDIQACELPFISYGKKRSFAGEVRTVRYIDGLSGVRDLINQPGKGQVLVIDATNAGWRAVFGDVMAGLVVRNGWEGVIVNGLIRDSQEINSMEIGVKALGTAPRRVNPGGHSQSDTQVTFGSITFTPGSRLVADEDGVVLLPAGRNEADYDTQAVVAATASYVVKGASE